MANEFKHKDPCATLTQAEYIGACGDGHIFACQATGDILYASSATVLSKLAKGNQHEILSMGGSNIPAWTASPSVTDLTISGGCITLSAATDIDLLDNNASALSFDSTGKAGIIDIITTDCSEGVTMSGTLGVTGVLTATGGLAGGAICIGSSTITTTGLISGGSLDIDNVLINGTTIGHTCDTDLITVGDQSVTIAGDLAISGGCITLTGAATDVDLIDNTASALSFDASGKTGIIDIVTTDCSEGVTMSGTLGVTGVLTATGGIELSHATANTLTASSGVLSIEGNVVYSAGGTDVPVADGGTGASTLTCGGILLGSGTGAITAMSVLAAGAIVKGDGSGDPVALTRGSANQVLTTKCCDISWAAAAAGGSLTLIGTQDATCCASLTQTGLDSTYDTYLIALADMHPASDGANIGIQLGDSSGIDTGACDYGYYTQNLKDYETTYSAAVAEGSARILLPGDGVGNAAGEGVGAVIWLHRPGDGVTKPILSGHGIAVVGSGRITGGDFFAERTAVITVDRVLAKFDTGNIVSGRMTVWGLAHA
jgi:hypothetical protein